MHAFYLRLPLLLTVVASLGGGGVPVSATTPALIQFTRFSSAGTFSAGSFSSTQIAGDRIVLAPGALSGSWVAPPVQPQASFTRLVASWNADTPAAGQLRIEAQATTSAGETSDWYTLEI